MVIYFRFEIQEEFMTTTLRIDDGLKRDCDAIFDDLGLSMAGAVTIFLKQVVKQRGIPFAITCDRQSPMDYILRREVGLNERGRIAKRFAAEMREGCERDWTMEDIDAEIAAARKDRKARKMS
jgi:DNA-damage-inducible protein J